MTLIKPQVVYFQGVMSQTRSTPVLTLRLGLNDLEMVAGRACKERSRFGTVVITLRVMSPGSHGSEVSDAPPTSADITRSVMTTMKTLAPSALSATAYKEPADQTSDMYPSTVRISRAGVV